MHEGCYIMMKWYHIKNYLGDESNAINVRHANIQVLENHKHLNDQSGHYKTVYYWNVYQNSFCHRLAITLIIEFYCPKVEDKHSEI